LTDLAALARITHQAAIRKRGMTTNDDRYEEWQKEADRIAKERSKKLRPRRVNEMLSKALLTRLEAHRPWHRLAWAAGITPAQLYRITSGVDRPDRDDPRIAKLAAHFGLAVEECFSDSEDKNPTFQTGAHHEEN